MTSAAIRTGHYDSSMAPGLTSGFQGSMNVHNGLLIVDGAVHKIFCIYMIPIFNRTQNKFVYVTFIN